MGNGLRLVAAAATCCAAVAMAKEPPEFTKARLAGATFVNVTAGMVAALGRDCAELLGKPATHAEDQLRAWIMRNKRYYGASVAYVSAMISQIEREEGKPAAEAAIAQFTRQVREGSTKNVAGLLARGEKAGECRNVTERVESGHMDIKPGAPFFDELESIVAYYGRTMER